MEEFFEDLGRNFKNHILGFFNAIPNVLAAILWLVIAFVFAGLAKNLVVKFLKALKIDKYLTKWGVTTETKNTAVEFIGKLVYFIVFLLFLPVAFTKLGISTLTSPINALVNSFIAFIPKLIGAFVVLFVGLLGLNDAGYSRLHGVRVKRGKLPVVPKCPVWPPLPVRF